MVIFRPYGQQQAFLLPPSLSDFLNEDGAALTSIAIAAGPRPAANS